MSDPTNPPTYTHEKIDEICKVLGVDPARVERLVLTTKSVEITYLATIEEIKARMPARTVVKVAKTYSEQVAEPVAQQ